MMPSPAQLDDMLESYAETTERPRYTPKKVTQNYKRIRRGKYADWDIEMILVPVEVWRHFADETQRGFYTYFGQHGSRRLYLVTYKGEEMGKFTTKLRATDFIQSKERS